ncbi:MAG: EthD family reductase [Pseudolabrys sp.]|nr:EthD family reductase [Pseudolabrys sp.]
MDTSCFIHFHGIASARPALLSAVESLLRSRPAGQGVAVMHTPMSLPGADPLPVDQDERLLLCQVDGAASAALAGTLDALARGIDGVREITHQCMALERITAGAPDDPRAPAQAVSWIVQYNGPAQDPAAFHAYYRAHHVPIVHRMPGIRSLSWYVPAAWSGPPGVARVEHLQIVQAVFDHAEGLIAMRNSPQRREGLSDFANYPSFQGPVTHQAMSSRRIAGQPDTNRNA